MTSTSPPPTSPPTPLPETEPTDQQQPLKSSHPLLHYAAYFIGVGTLVFVAQIDEPKRTETALLAGAISAGSVVSRDWFKARLSPSMADDPTALITLFSEMLHAGRSQSNTNAAHLKRVEFLQVDLIDAMRSFNDLLRLSPEEIEKRLQTVQTANLTSALSATAIPKPMPEPISAGHTPPPVGDTYRPDSTTLRQSFRQNRPGFDA